MAGKRSTSENPADRGDVDAQPTPEPVNPAGEAQATTVEEAVPKLATSDKAPAFVQYVGTADVREIDAAAWKQIDVNDQGKVVWDRRKFRGDRLPVDQFTAAALEYLIQFDGGFVLLDEDGKKIA